MNKFKFIILIVATLFLGSCSIGKNISEKDIKTTSFMPNIVQLNLELDDFEYVGEAEVTIVYKKILGFTLLYEINGKPVNRNQINSLELHGRTFIPVIPGLERALFDTHRTMPDADIMIPFYTLTEKQNMFLASNVTKTLKVKAYKFRH